MLVRAGNKSDMRVGVPNSMACWVSSAYQVAFGVSSVGVMILVITAIGSSAEEVTESPGELGLVNKNTNKMINNTDNRIVTKVSDCRLESLKARCSGFWFSMAMGVISSGVDWIFFR